MKKQSVTSRIITRNLFDAIPLKLKREIYRETQYYLFNQAAGSSQIYYCTQVWLEEKDSHVCDLWIRQLVTIKASTIRNRREIARKRLARRWLYIFLTSLKSPSTVNAIPLYTALFHLAIAIITSDTNHTITVDRMRQVATNNRHCHLSILYRNNCYDLTRFFEAVFKVTSD